MALRKSRSVFVNGDLIASDRGALTQEALAGDPGNSVTLPTLKRAEHGGPISLQSLENIARALKREPERYLRSTQEGGNQESSLLIAGRWHVFYVEDDREKSPYICRETSKMRQYGSKIRGQYECLTYVRPVQYHLDGVIYKEVIYGKYHVKGRDSAIGLGLFELKAMRENDWFEGYCMWYDYDREMILSSKNIWIREGANYFDILQGDANKIMLRELDMFNIRINTKSL